MYNSNKPNLFKNQLRQISVKLAFRSYWLSLVKDQSKCKMLSFNVDHKTNICKTIFQAENVAIAD